MQIKQIIAAILILFVGISVFFLFIGTHRKAERAISDAASLEQGLSTGGESTPKGEGSGAALPAGASGSSGAAGSGLASDSASEGGCCLSAAGLASTNQSGSSPGSAGIAMSSEGSTGATGARSATDGSRGPVSPLLKASELCSQSGTGCLPSPSAGSVGSGPVPSLSSHSGRVPVPGSTPVAGGVERSSARACSQSVAPVKAGGAFASESGMGAGSPSKKPTGARPHPRMSTTSSSAFRSCRPPHRS